MKIWHYKIIQKLPRPLLLSLHRDCCRVRGSGWGKATTPNAKWLWNYSFSSLEWYHLLVIQEMEARNWNPDPLWKVSGYRGKKVPRLPKKWETVPENWPEGMLFKEFTPNYLFKDQETLRKWEKDHLG